MEDFVKEQIKCGIKTLPANLIKSFFIPKSNEDSEKFRAKDFICGICHPGADTEQLKNANIGWVRFDIPFPYEKDGSISNSYIRFKEEAKMYVDAGIKVMAVTPYHSSYTENGIDIQSAEGEKKIKEIALFMLNDMRDIVSAYQITNEMGIPRFTVPLTIKQAARFIGIQLEAMYPERGDIVIGYNAAGPQPDLQYHMKPYFKYCDYIGYDLYMGCFFTLPGFLFIYDAITRYLWALTRKPILIQEFGYISGGAPKTKEEKAAIIKSYGFDSEKAARKNIVQFVNNLPDEMRERVEHDCQKDESKYLDFVLKGDFRNHIFKELPRITKIPGYPHTPEGQAKFFTKIIDKLYKQKCVGGMFIYCWHDSNSCYVCGQKDCPTETRWGLVDVNGKEKPSYYAVKEAFGKIRNNKNK